MTSDREMYFLSLYLSHITCHPSLKKDNDKQSIQTYELLLV